MLDEATLTLMALDMGQLPAPALPKNIGPFQVNPVMYELKTPAHYIIHTKFYVSLLKPHHPPVSVPSAEPGPSDEPSVPLIIDEKPIYAVKKILNS